MKPQHIQKPRRRAMVSAFLLPLCPRCGGGMSLAVFESGPVAGAAEVRTFRCDECGTQCIERDTRLAAGAQE